MIAEPPRFDVGSSRVGLRARAGISPVPSRFELYFRTERRVPSPSCEPIPASAMLVASDCSRLSSSPFELPTLAARPGISIQYNGLRFERNP